MFIDRAAVGIAAAAIALRRLDALVFTGGMWLALLADGLAVRVNAYARPLKHG